MGLVFRQLATVYCMVVNIYGAAFCGFNSISEFPLHDNLSNRVGFHMALSPYGAAVH